MVMPTNLIAPTARERSAFISMVFDGTVGTSNIDMFTIYDGSIYIVDFYGYVADTIAATGAVNIFNAFTRTEGAANGPLNGTLVITADAIGTVYTMTGTVANALQASAAAVIPLPSFTATNWILPPGVIDLDMTNAAGDVAGTIEWTIVYIPLNPSVMVEPM